MYQNQPQFTPSQNFLPNNDNFNIVNYSRNNFAHQNKTMPGCTCCNLNQYPANSYFNPRQLKPKQEEKNINMINKRQINSNSNGSDDKKFNNPQSRLEKAKQFVRKVESESLTSSLPVATDLSTNQFQNQFYPIDVLYTLLPMYLSPILNRQAYQNQQPIDPAYIQSLVNFFLNMNQPIQSKTYSNNNQQSNKSINTLNNNQTKNGPKKTNRSRILIQDIDSKVEEHFKRSLGNDYVNLISNSKRIKLDNNNNLAKEALQPSSPTSSIKTVSSCTSPTLNINENNKFQRSPEIVEKHFSKALGVDAWNRLKEKIRSGSDGSDGSSTVSSMSDTSISPVKF